MKRFLPLLLILPLLLYWSCEEDTAGPKAVITFEKDIGHGKLAVKQTKDGGYIVAGGNSDAWLLKTDKYGNKEWENTYSLGAFGNSRAVIQTGDGGYLYAGWEGIVKADSNGVEEWKTGTGLYVTQYGFNMMWGEQKAIYYYGDNKLAVSSYEPFSGDIIFSVTAQFPD